jgi:hypothetical protein
MLFFLSLTLAGAIAGSSAGAPSPNSKTAPAVIAPTSADVAMSLLTADTRRIRTTAPRVSAVINEGVRRSRTFAGLVAELHKTNVIVYVETSMGLPPDVAGRILFAGAAGNQRYLRVQLSAALPRDQMISVIAHELRHALEVAGEQSVISEKALEEFYKRVGDTPHAGGGYDTEAARVAQRTVRHELNG